MDKMTDGHEKIFIPLPSAGDNERTARSGNKSNIFMTEMTDTAERKLKVSIMHFNLLLLFQLSCLSGPLNSLNQYNTN